jgi:hypothetical protein
LTNIFAPATRSAIGRVGVTAIQLARWSVDCDNTSIMAERNDRIKVQTQGAWVVHHAKKLSSIANPGPDYEQIVFSGRSGLLLSSLAATEQRILEKSTVANLAKALHINTRLELPTILDELQRQRLIERSDSGIEVLALTTAQTLEQTARIFAESGPTQAENAAIYTAELASDSPITTSDVRELLSDTFEIARKETGERLEQFADIGFVDAEPFDQESIYFNGNLFRKQSAQKIAYLLGSLSAEDSALVTELVAQLKQSGCLPQRSAAKVVGEELLDKLISVGFLDKNVVMNEAGEHSFVTVPSAFNKFDRSSVDDAFDLAKAFVTSLTYGMLSSTPGRGRIKMIELLMSKLISGGTVGPATAIGQDYRALELKGVVKVMPHRDGRYSMRLLKRDVGEIALKVIQQGEAYGQPLQSLPRASVAAYVEPEANRTVIRKRSSPALQTGVRDIIASIRTGDLR